MFQVWLKNRITDLIWITAVTIAIPVTVPVEQCISSTNVNHRVYGDEINIADLGRIFVSMK